MKCTHISKLASRLFAVGLILVVIGGCAQNDMTDLQRYVERVKATPPGPLEPVPQPKPYETFAYAAQGLRSPFIPESKRHEEAIEKGQIACKFEPDPKRARELLEGYSLDSLKMMGSLRQGDNFWGLVRSSDGTIHRVSVGNHLGQNFGRITKITETEIDLIELVPDREGCWEKRNAALALSEQQ